MTWARLSQDRDAIDAGSARPFAVLGALRRPYGKPGDSRPVRDGLNNASQTVRD